MATAPGDQPSRIGAILKEERTRQGLEIGAVEERTKIRTKYLRALENEDWDVLPGPAYTRGYLRTYASMLGLDADALIDEYRERFEEPETHPLGLGEPVLRGGIPRDGERSRFDRRIIVGILVAGVAALLLVLGLAGGSGDEDKSGKGGEHKGAKHGGKGEKQKKAQPTPDTVELKVAARSPSVVCLVSQGGAVLLDNSTMEAGDDESFEADTFDLSLGFGGVVEVTANGDSQRLKATPDEPLTWEIAPRGVRDPVADPNPEKCP